MSSLAWSNIGVSVGSELSVLTLIPHGAGSVRNGLVSRRVIASSPVAVEYAITALGRTLQDPFVARVGWARQHGAAM